MLTPIPSATLSEPRRRYPATRVDRGPDAPQPGPLAVGVPRPVQRSAHPERPDRPVERPARAPPGPEVPGVQDLVLPEVLREGLREPDRARDPLDLPRDERVVEPVLPPDRKSTRLNSSHANI